MITLNQIKEEHIKQAQQVFTYMQQLLQLNISLDDAQLCMTRFNITGSLRYTEDYLHKCVLLGYEINLSDMQDFEEQDTIYWLRQKIDKASSEFSNISENPYIGQSKTMYLWRIDGDYLVVSRTPECYTLQILTKVELPRHVDYRLILNTIQKKAKETGLNPDLYHLSLNLTLYLNTTLQIYKVRSTGVSPNTIERSPITPLLKQHYTSKVYNDGDKNRICYDFIHEGISCKIFEAYFCTSSMNGTYWGMSSTFTLDEAEIPSLLNVLTELTLELSSPAQNPISIANAVSYLLVNYDKAPEAVKYSLPKYEGKVNLAITDGKKTAYFPHVNYILDYHAAGIKLYAVTDAFFKTFYILQCQDSVKVLSYSSEDKAFCRLTLLTSYDTDIVDITGELVEAVTFRACASLINTIKYVDSVTWSTIQVILYHYRSLLLQKAITPATKTLTLQYKYGDKVTKEVLHAEVDGIKFFTTDDYTWGAIQYGYRDYLVCDRNNNYTAILVDSTEHDLDVLGF